MPALQCRDGRRVAMANTKEQQLQAFARRAARVSRALWPTNVRRAIATGRMAQTRRRLIVTGRYWRSGRFKSRTYQAWRPQGSPLLYAKTGRRRRIVVATLAVAMLILASASIMTLIAAHLWLLLPFLSMVIAATVLLLAIVRRRVLNMKRLQQGVEARSFPGVLSRAHSPTTPMPLEPPLVRVLETFDLSQTDVEHFLDLPEGGNTGGYSLTNLKEAQSKLPRTVRE